MFYWRHQLVVTQLNNANAMPMRIASMDVVHVPTNANCELITINPVLAGDTDASAQGSIIVVPSAARSPER